MGLTEHPPPPNCVSSERSLAKLDAILYDRPAGRNIIEHAIETIEKLRQELKVANSFYKVAIKERDYERARNNG